ncbi:hypothetical protein GC173_13475 [bacterium]|nr:hypothetical protein [bacterium]
MKSRSVLAAVFGLFAACCLSSCVAFKLPEDGGGRSGIQQLLLTKTIDQAVEDINLTSDSVFDKQVYLIVGDVENNQVTSDYVHSALAMKLIFMNASVVDTASDAEVILYVKVQSAGVDATTDPFSLANIFKSIFYTSDTMRARADIEVNALDTGPEGGMVYAENLTASARNSYRQFRIFFNLIGPFKHTTIRGIKY